jgi:hypothetical protein
MAPVAIPIAAQAVAGREGCGAFAGGVGGAADGGPGGRRLFA